MLSKKILFLENDVDLLRLKPRQRTHAFSKNVFENIVTEGL